MLTALPVISYYDPPSPLGSLLSSTVQHPPTSVEFDTEIVYLGVSSSLEWLLELAPSMITVGCNSSIPSGTTQVVSGIITAPLETVIENVLIGGMIASAEPSTLVEVSVLSTLYVSTT